MLISKKSKHIRPDRIIALCLALVMMASLAACGSGQSVWRVKYTSEHDEYGNVSNRNFSINPATGNLTALSVLGSGTNYTYDEKGNLQQESHWDQRGTTDILYEYTYDSDDLPGECTVSTDGRILAQWEFDWDDGALVRAEQQIIWNNADTWNVWQEYAYDSDGRLETEYWCWAQVDSTAESVLYYTLRCYEYEYDRDGNLEQIRFSISGQLDEQQAGEPEDQSLEEVYSLELSYDEGNLVRYRLRSEEQTEEGDVDYDRQGNREAFLGGDADYDKDGNLTEIEFPNGSETELNYEETDMDEAAAARYGRWASIHGVDPDRMEVQYLLRGSHAHDDVFYYYLIPNPVW